MKADVVELIGRPARYYMLGGREVEVKRVDIIRWYALDRAKRAIANAFGEPFGWLDAVLLMGEFFEIATGTSTSDILLSEALVAISDLWAFNELRYIDPAVRGIGDVRNEGVFEEGLENAVLVDIVVTLGSRFSMDEIRDMSPEFAFLAWQRIVDDEANLKTAIFYATELGYEKTQVGKDGRYKLRPRPSPYQTPWQEFRYKAYVKAEQDRRLAEPIPRSPFIKHPEKIKDARRRRKDGEEIIQ